MSWYCFSRKFLCSPFSRLLTSKGRWARFRLSFPVVNIIKRISVIKLRLHERKRSPVITIVRSYRAAMFVLHVDILKARAMFAPRSRAVEKLYEASLTSECCFSLHHSFTRRKRTFFFNYLDTRPMNNAINVYTFPRYKEICALKFSSKPNFFENLVCF